MTRTAPRPVVDQKTDFENRRKLDMAIEWLQLQVQMKRRARMFGRVVVELLFRSGHLERVKMLDETTIDDMSDTEREKLLAATATSNENVSGKAG